MQYINGREILSIACDFDGTLCSENFPEIGEFEEAHQKLIDLLIRIRQSGHKLILWTCRMNLAERSYLDEAVEYCAAKGLHFDFVNENPLPDWGYFPRKIFADIYLDDRALNNFDYKKLEELI